MATDKKFILNPDDRGSITEEIPFVGSEQSYSTLLTGGIEFTLAVPARAKRAKFTIQPGGWVHIGFGDTALTPPGSGSWSNQNMEPNPILRTLTDDAGNPITTLRFLSANTGTVEINVIFYP